MKTLIPILVLALAGPSLSLAESVPKKKSGANAKAKSSSSSSTSSGAGTKAGKSSATAKSKSAGTAGSKPSTSSTAQGGSGAQAKDDGKAEETRPKTPLETIEDVTEGPESGSPRLAAVSSVEPEEIDGFDSYAPQIQALIRKALGLTKQNLTYTFGSADPKRGGMDCSGTIYFLLHDFGFKDVPRSSDEMCGWVQNKTLLHRIQKADSLGHIELSALQPGNLIFWSGTYATAPRKIPVTHVMLYLGKLKKGGKPVVFGASDGRSYQGQRRTGVSVFDFTLPRSGGAAALYGYGLIPGVGKIEVTPAPVEVAKAETPVTPDTGKEKDEGKETDNADRKDDKEVAAAPKPMKAGKEKGEDPGETGSKPVSKASEEGAEKAAETSKPSAVKKPASKAETSGSSSIRSKSGSSSTTRKKSTGSSEGGGERRSGTKSSSSSSSTSSTQSPMAKARAAAGGFLEEVRRALPAGR